MFSIMAGPNFVSWEKVNSLPDKPILGSSSSAANKDI